MIFGWRGLFLSIFLSLSVFLGVSQSASQSAFGAVRTTVYSEQVYLEHRDLFSANARARAEASTNFGTPYLQLGTEFQSPIFDLRDLDKGGSYLHLGPGFRFQWGGWSLALESRFRFYYVASELAQNQPSFDGRAILVYGNFWQGVLNERYGFRTFAELYSETVFTSADSNNVILANFLRGGLRVSTPTGLTADLFIEPFFTLDRVGHFYNNRADTKLSLRTGLKFSPFNFSITGSLIANQYFNGRSLEVNPFKDRFFGFRVLGVLGANL